MSGRHEAGDLVHRRDHVVVFDRDGTLVAGDSFGAFLRHLIQRRSLRRIAAVATAPAWLPALFLPPTRLFAEQYLVWLVAVGMDEETFAAAAHWLPSSPRTPSPRSVAR